MPHRKISRRAIIWTLNATVPYRVRFGIGRPPGRQFAAEFVLKPFTSTERRELDLHVNRAADAVESLVTDGLERTQNLFNS